MDLNEFWSLIDKSRAVDGDCETQVQRLTEQLALRPPGDIADFQRHLDERLDETYRWDLWAVAYIANGGCSDDGFDYFRGWLIAQGRAYFEAALRDPERAADRIQPGEYAECETLLYATYEAHQQATGDDLETVGRATPRAATPAGEPWDEDRVDELFPALAQRFAT